MKRTLIGLSVLLLMGFLAPQLMGAPASNKPQQPADVCYSFDNYETDWLRLKIQPGNSLVTGVYQLYLTGASPGSGLAFALLVGTIQDVTDANTFPYLGSDTTTQIALNGTIASGNFDPPKAKQCGVHLVFESSAMAAGTAFVWCDYWASPDGTLTEYDKFEEPFTKADCAGMSGP